MGKNTVGADMSITVITGKNRVGKSLFLLDHVIKNYGEDRRIYYWRIPELKLDWEKLDRPEQWYTYPAGSVFVIDECHKVFVQRAMNARMPDHVSRLDEHGHSGYDFVLVTQHPHKVDIEVRDLADLHIHLRRPVSKPEHAFVYQWPEVRDIRRFVHEKKDAQKTKFEYPTKLYGMYKSADVHNVKQKMTINMKPLFITIGVMFMLVNFLTGNLTGKSILDRVGITGDPVADVTAETNDILTTTAEPKKPATKESQKPAQDSLIASKLNTMMPQPDMMKYQFMQKADEKPEEESYVCVASATRCICHTEQSTRVDITEKKCRMLVDKGIYRKGRKRGIGSPITPYKPKYYMGAR